MRFDNIDEIRFSGSSHREMLLQSFLDPFIYVRLKVRCCHAITRLEITSLLYPSFKDQTQQGFAQPIVRCESASVQPLLWSVGLMQCYERVMESNVLLLPPSTEFREILARQDGDDVS